jgi:hypothetical protein
MGFVANVGDAGETLFVARDIGHNNVNHNGELATIDTSTFQLTSVGDFSPTNRLRKNRTRTT